METCRGQRNRYIHVMGKTWRHVEDMGIETFMSEGPHGDMGIAVHGDMGIAVHGDMGVAVHGDMYGKNGDICVACHMGCHMYICARAGERQKETWKLSEKSSRILMKNIHDSPSGCLISVCPPCR